MVNCSVKQCVYMVGMSKKVQIHKWGIFFLFKAGSPASWGGWRHSFRQLASLLVSYHYGGGGKSDIVVSCPARQLNVHDNTGAVGEVILVMLRFIVHEHHPSDCALKTCRVSTRCCDRYLYWVVHYSGFSGPSLPVKVRSTFMARPKLPL